MGLIRPEPLFIEEFLLGHEIESHSGEFSGQHTSTQLAAVVLSPLSNCRW